MLLLDEPLAALDAHTRGVVRGELNVLLGELGLPTLLVTHDFRDAAVLADRIGVIVDGTLRQLDTAERLIDHPADAFVVSLIGGNLLLGSARPLAGGGSEVMLDDGGIVRSEMSAAGRVQVAVYPWEITVCAAASGVAAGAAARAGNEITGPVTSLSPEAGHVRVRVGGVLADSSRAELERLGVMRGGRARARFAVAHTRLLPLGDQ